MTALIGHGASSEADVIGHWGDWAVRRQAAASDASRQLSPVQRRAADQVIVTPALSPLESLSSALGRDHLTADLAARVGLGVNIDVPVARHHLLRLFRREGCFAFDGVADGSALLAQPD